MNENILNSEKIKELEVIANKIRHLIIKMIYKAKSGHPGGSLSIADIITALYFNELRIDPENPKWEDRDRFVLSKGHAAPAYYAALALRGFFPEEELFTLRDINSRLQGHPSMITPGVDMSTGSLGQGLGVAVGMALAAKLDKRAYNIYAIVGDGEANEGSIWESSLYAAHRKLDNLIVFLDRNRIQLDGPTEEILSLGNLEEKWKSFGWDVLTIDGHDIKEILNAVNIMKNIKDKPKIIIANTIKGKGVSYMENTAAYHGKAPQNDEDYEKALSELDIIREGL
jgi:transketolase